jgi:VCBS repeat-containing protein
MLTGDVITTVTQAMVIDTKGTVSLFVKAEGIWVYQFTDASKAALAKLIANKSTSDAETLLANAAGVDKVDSIDISGGGSTLPSDPKQITIVVLGVPGLQGTPTVPPGNTTIGPGGPIATPTPQNGIGSSYG